MKKTEPVSTDLATLICASVIMTCNIPSEMYGEEIKLLASIFAHNSIHVIGTQSQAF